MAQEFDRSLLPDKKKKFDRSLLPDQREKKKKITQEELNANLANLKKVNATPLKSPTTYKEGFNTELRNWRRGIPDTLTALAGFGTGAILDAPGAIWEGMKTVGNLITDPIDTSRNVWEGIRSIPGQISQTAANSTQDPFTFGRTMGQIGSPVPGVGVVSKILSKAPIAKIVGKPIEYAGKVAKNRALSGFFPDAIIPRHLLRAEHGIGKGVEWLGEKIGDTNIRFPNIPPPLTRAAQTFAAIPEERLPIPEDALLPPSQDSRISQLGDPLNPNDNQLQAEIEFRNKVRAAGGEPPLTEEEINAIITGQPSKQGFFQGLMDVPEELLDYIKSNSDKTTEELKAGNYGRAFFNAFEPMYAPFRQAMNLTFNPEYQDPEIAREAGINTALGMAGIPVESFRQAWESEDYPRIAGQATGALGTFLLGRGINNRLNRPPASRPPIRSSEPGRPNRPLLEEPFLEGEILDSTPTPLDPRPPNVAQRPPTAPTPDANPIAVTPKNPTEMAYWIEKGYVPASNDTHLVRSDLAAVYGSFPSKSQSPVQSVETSSVGTTPILNPLPEGRVSSPFEMEMRAKTAAMRVEGLDSTEFEAVRNGAVTPDFLRRSADRLELVKQGPEFTFFKKKVDEPPDPFGGFGGDGGPTGIQGPSFAPPDSGGSGGVPPRNMPPPLAGIFTQAVQALEGADRGTLREYHQIVMKGINTLSQGGGDPAELAAYRRMHEILSDKMKFPSSTSNPPFDPEYDAARPTDVNPYIRPTKSSEITPYKEPFDDMPGPSDPMWNDSTTLRLTRPGYDAPDLRTRNQLEKIGSQGQLPLMRVPRNTDVFGVPKNRTPNERELAEINQSLQNPALQAAEAFKRPYAPQAEQLSMEDSMKDAEIADFLRREDGTPPEMIDLSKYTPEMMDPTPKPKPQKWELPVPPVGKPKNPWGIQPPLEMPDKGNRRSELEPESTEIQPSETAIRMNRRSREAELQEIQAETNLSRALDTAQSWVEIMNQAENNTSERDHALDMLIAANNVTSRLLREQRERRLQITRPAPREELDIEEESLDPEYSDLPPDHEIELTPAHQNQLQAVRTETDLTQANENVNFWRREWELLESSDDTMRREHAYRMFHAASRRANDLDREDVETSTAREEERRRAEEDRVQEANRIRKEELRAATGVPNPPIKFGLQEKSGKREIGISKEKQAKLRESGGSRVLFEEHRIDRGRKRSEYEMKRNSWDGWADDVLTSSKDGEPGLSIEDKSYSHAYPGMSKDYLVVYRGPDGKPIASAKVHEDGSTGVRTVSTLAANRFKGLLSGRAVKAVGEALIDMNATEATGIVSGYTANLIARLGKLTKEGGNATVIAGLAATLVAIMKAMEDQEGKKFKTADELLNFFEKISGVTFSREAGDEVKEALN